MAATLRGIVIPADTENALYLEEIERDCRPQYEWLVAGDVRTVRLFRTECVLYTNKASSLNAKPVNERATRIMHFHKPLAKPDDAVMGDAFILGNDNTHAPKELIAVLLEAASLRVEACFSDVWKRQTVTYDSWQEAYTAAMETTALWEGQVGVRVVPA